MLQGQLVSKGAVFVSMMILSRYLDDLWFGRLLFAVVLSVFSAFITDFGTSILVNRELSMGSMPNSRELWRSALGFRTLTGCLALVSITLFSLLNYPMAQTLVLIPVLLGVTIENVSELPFACFRASGQARHEARARTGSAFVFLALVALLLLFRAHPAVFPLAFLLRGGVLGLCSFSASGRMGFPLKPAYRREHLLRLFSEAWPLGVMGFLTVLHQRVDNLVIEGRLGVVSVGAYNEIFKVVEVLILIITPTLLPGALFPGLCRAFRTGAERALPEMRRIALLVSALSAAVTALILPPGQLFMRVLWGEAFLRGVTPEAFNATRILLFSAVPFAYFMNFLLAALIASGRQKATLPAVFSGFAVSLALNLVLVGRIGLPGAGVAALASNGVIALICGSILGGAVLRRIAVPVLLAVPPIPGILILDHFFGLSWPLLTGFGLLLALPAAVAFQRSTALPQAEEEPETALNR